MSPESRRRIPKYRLYRPKNLAVVRIDQRDHYGHVPVEQFGPLALIACRQKLIEAGLCRKRINGHVTRIRHM